MEFYKLTIVVKENGTHTSEYNKISQEEYVDGQNKTYPTKDNTRTHIEYFNSFKECFGYIKGFETSLQYFKCGFRGEKTDTPPKKLDIQGNAWNHNTSKVDLWERRYG